MTNDFEPGSLGFTAAWLVSGPLDGIAYSDIPLFPDGKPPHGLTVPLADDQAGTYAAYVRRDAPALDGRWYYDFVHVTADPTPVEPVPSPVGTVVGGFSTGMSTASDASDQNESPHEVSFEPAPRFVLAQAWWIASEICRRQSHLRVLESWPLDGFYHGLEIGYELNQPHIFMNLVGRIHFFPFAPTVSLFEADPEPIPWARVLGAESPHEIVKVIEGFMGWTNPTADATTPRSLVYRLIAAVLSANIDDRERWNIASAYGEGGFEEWPSLLDDYQGCRLALQKDTQMMPPPSTRVWLIKRGRDTVTVLSELGLLFSRHGDPVDLMSIYKRRHELSDVVAVCLTGEA